MISLKGAKTLHHFSEALIPHLGLSEDEFEIIQIHASPASIEEDIALLNYARRNKNSRKFLIHRPDELLSRSPLKKFFEEYPLEKLIFLGDLIFKDQFWNARKLHSQIIPHPFLDFSLPYKLNDKFVVGAYTIWGEMRKLEHYLELVTEISRIDKEKKFAFMIGGTLNGKPLPELGNEIIISSNSFTPHFNVQLYHLNDKKRFGESSGSLHRGISVPVIFEANGMERLESMKIIKIDADDELREINYKKAAEQIFELTQNGPEKFLEHNYRQGIQNTAEKLIRSII